MIKAQGPLSSHLKGVEGILDSKWSFTVADNDYRPTDPIKVQANGVYARLTPTKRIKNKYEFALVFRCGKKGGRLKLTRIIVSGHHSGQMRREIRSELEARFKHLKKLNLKLL
jgi:hypothetical protein